MFARYPKGRMTLRDLVRVKFQRMLLKVAFYGVLLMSGVLDSARSYAVEQAPIWAAELETAIIARQLALAEAEAEATAFAQLRADCVVSRGAGIAFHSVSTCTTR